MDTIERLEYLKKLRAEAKLGGGQKRIDKLHSQGRMTARATSTGPRNNAAFWTPAPTWSMTWSRSAAPHGRQCFTMTAAVPSSPAAHSMAAATSASRPTP